MLKVPHRDALYSITGVRNPVPKADPLEAINKTQQAMLELLQRPQVQAPPPAPMMSPDRKPVRLEADIERDKGGKMTRITITPIYG